jgi:hypothetical protein
LSDGTADLPLRDKCVVMGSLWTVCTVASAERLISPPSVEEDHSQGGGPWSPDCGSGLIGDSYQGFVWARERLLRVSEWDPSEKTPTDRTAESGCPTAAADLVEGFLGARAAARKVLAEVSGHSRGTADEPQDRLTVLKRCVTYVVKPCSGACF